MRQLQLFSATLIPALFVMLTTFTPAWSATIGAPLYQPKTPPGAIDYREGIMALSKGDLKLAKEAFQATLASTPAHVGAIIGLAEISMKEKATEVTESYLQQALDIAPKNAVIHQILGRHLTQQARLEEAEAAYLQAVNLEPKLFRLHLEMGDFYLQRVHQPQKAIKAYEAALALQPAHAGAHFGLGSALANAGKIDQAMNELKEAGRIAPTNPLPFFGLGRIHAVRKHYDQASQAFGKAIQAQPKFVPAHVARGDVYTLQKQDSKAIQDYEAARTLAPRIPGLHVKLGLIFERNERFEEAVESFRTAISLDPKQPIALNNLAWISVQHNTRLDEAVAWAEQAVALAPTISAFQDTLGWVHRKRGDLDKAAEVLKKATTLKPEQADIFYHLGVVETERGQTQQAVTALEKALQLDNTFTDANDARQRLQALQTP